jgi:hypothetical protein
MLLALKEKSLVKERKSSYQFLEFSQLFGYFFKSSPIEFDPPKADHVANSVGELSILCGQMARNLKKKT